MTADTAAFLSEAELREIGFTRIGKSVQVSRKASFYSIRGSIGDHSRIDDFCILKGQIEVGKFVHIAAYCSVSGAAGRVSLGDYSTLAPRVSIFTASDDYLAPVLNNPLLPSQFKCVHTGEVRIGSGAIVGAHSVVLPRVVIGDGASVGALVIVHRSLPEGGRCINQAAKCALIGTRDVERIRQLIGEFEQSRLPARSA